jgi:hypothetical protein
MIRAMVLASIMLVMAGSLQAQDRLTIGEGATSCGTWTQARQNRSAGLAAQWVAGYLSGSNMDTNHPDALVGADFQGLVGWIDNYCRANPLDPLVIAAWKLFRELQSRANGR